MGTVARPSLELATMAWTNSGWLRRITPTRSPGPSPARRSSHASRLPLSARSPMRTSSTGRSPFSKTRANRSGSSSACLATSRAKTASSWAGSRATSASGDEDVNGARGGVGPDPAAPVLRQGHPGSRHLPLPTPAVELPGQLDDLRGSRGADRVAASQKPAARVDRQLASQPGHPVEDQSRGVSRAAESKLLVELELRHRGRVVQLDHVQVLGTQPGPFVRLT